MTTYGYLLQERDKRFDHQTAVIGELNSLYSDLFAYDQEPGYRFGGRGDEQNPFSLMIPTEQWDKINKRLLALSTRVDRAYSDSVGNRFTSIRRSLANGAWGVTVTTDSTSGKMRITGGKISKTHEETQQIANAFQNLLILMRDEASDGSDDWLPLGS